jgi:polar amino acid transport system substrate-binding protein
MVTLRTLATALTLLFSSITLFAVEKDLRVGVAGQDPFIKTGSIPTGAAVDIWEKIAAENNWNFNYTRFETIKKGLEAVTDGSIDLLVGNTPITKNNLANAEFSQPFFHSGLQILTVDSRSGIRSRLLSDIQDLFKLEIFWVALVGIVILSTTVYFFERKHNPDFPKGRNEGIAEAVYYVVTLALTGRSSYRGFSGVLGRIMLVTWLILGMITAAYVTASITSSMTAERLSNSIENLRDLQNKTVSVIADSPAEDFIKDQGIDEIPASDIQSAVNELLENRVQAVVADAAVLQSFDFNNPRLPLRVVGRVFQVENYGFAMPIGSPLRMPLNRHLAKMQEDQETHDILAGYFGEANVQ